MPQAASTTEILFYDGHCGLCHRAVKFVLKHDGSENAFRFAPLQGPTFQARVPANRRAGLPDSIVVLTAIGRAARAFECLPAYSAAAGRGWRALASALAVVPRPLRDLIYDFIARIRYRVFGKRDELCPIVPQNLRARFDP